MENKITIKRTEGYTIMPNHHLRSKTLSLKGKGLMSFMLSLPEDWDYTEVGLVSVLKEGRDAVRSALKELEDHGYLVREKKSRKAGMFGSSNYILYEYPQDSTVLDYPTLEKPTSDYPTLENPTQINTDLIITDLITKEVSNTYGQKMFDHYDRNDTEHPFNIFWELYPNKVKRKDSMKKFKQKVRNDETLFKVCQDVSLRNLSKEWTKDNGRYVPHPTTYLNQELWEDESFDIQKSDYKGPQSGEGE